MAKIIPVYNSLNIYTKTDFKLVSKQNIVFEGRTVQKLTFCDAHSTAWKVWQVFLAALLTLTTLCLALCFDKNRKLWRDSLERFKERIFYQDAPIKLSTKVLELAAEKLSDTTEKELPLGEKPVSPKNVLPSGSIIQVKPSLDTAATEESAPEPVEAAATPAQVLKQTINAEPDPTKEAKPDPDPAASQPLTISISHPNVLAPTTVAAPPQAPDQTALLKAAVYESLTKRSSKTFTRPDPAQKPRSLGTADEIKLQQDKAIILQSNPEYSRAVEAWENAGVSLKEQVRRLEELKQYAFGNDKWSQYFGEIIGKVPLLPAEIYEIYSMKDRFDKVHKDTHVLVLVPAAVMVDGKKVDISLKSIGELVANAKNGGHKTKYSSLKVPGFEDTLVDESHWVFMKKTIVPGTMNQPFDEQLNMIAQHNAKHNVDYIAPSAIDTVACTFLTYVDTAVKLFGFDNEERRYTRCMERVEGKYPIYIGGFLTATGMLGGLEVGFSTHRNKSKNSGMACMQAWSHYYE